MTATAMKGMVLLLDADSHWLDRLIYLFNEKLLRCKFLFFSGCRFER